MLVVLNAVKQKLYHTFSLYKKMLYDSMKVYAKQKTCASTFKPINRQLYVTSRCSIETAEQIDLNFDTEAIVRLSYTVLYGNSGMFDIKVLPSGTFFYKLWT